MVSLAALFSRLAEWLRCLVGRRRPTVAEVLDHHLAARRGEVVDLARLEHGAKALRRHLGSIVVAELRPMDARRYAQLRREAGKGAGTIGQELAQLRAALRFAHEDGLVGPPPLLKGPPAPPPRDRWLTREEAGRLLEACRAPHLRLFVLLALHTGARSGAIRALTWDRVDFGARLIDYAEAGRAATRKGRPTVPINATLLAALEEARREAGGTHVVAWRGRPIGDPRRAFADAAARAGLAGVTPHVLRHSVATWLDKGGVELRRIAGVLGHSDSRTTERVYIHGEAEILRDAVELLA